MAKAKASKTRVYRPKNKKAKANPRPPRARPGTASTAGRSLEIFLLWVGRIALLAAVIGLIVWQWDNILAWFDDLAAGTLSLFGWGIGLIALAVLIILGFAFRRQITAFAVRWKLYQWNKVLSAAAFFFAIWGILALFDKGGSFGRAIISSNPLIAILRVIGLLLLGIVLVAPRASFRALRGFSRWFFGLFRMPAPIPREKQATTTRPNIAEARTQPRPGATEKFQPARPARATLPLETTPRQPAAEAALAPRREYVTGEGEPQKDLKQVAQDVWKKYGESASLVVIDGWKLPPIDILEKTTEVELSDADNQKRAKIIEEALASYGVDARVAQINAGPTVTQFGVEPGWDIKTKEFRERDENGKLVIRQKEIARTRVKVERITSLGNDLALALAAPSLRIEAPVPGKSIVGIEVPNTVYSAVSLRGVIETNSFQKILTKSNLAIALGKGAGGEAVSGDLAKMPHLLIAGATGSGKTVCLNAIVCCLLMYNTPFDVRFIMIDPKRVELTFFTSLPHLAAPVIVDTDKALGALRWLNQEMDNRYKRLAAEGARNIEGYNKNKKGKDRMPNLVLIIDELADLMMAGFDEVEHILCRLAQLARAVGIHLVVATQRPSVDVVTGLIKANFPTRISFAVTSQVDSRTILDGAGAEKLLGRGDMLYMPTEAAKPKRLQGCFVSDPEVERLVYFWSSQKNEEAAPAQLKVEDIVVPGAAAPGKKSHQPDPMLESARKLMEEHQNISTSYLQRKLHIGYPRAARIMEELEEETGKVIDDGGAEV